MRIPNAKLRFDPGGNLAPWDEYVTATPGVGYPFKDFPIMSRYTCVASGSEALYVKIANNDAAGLEDDRDCNATVSGDLTITGTLTAGDVVITT